MPTRTRWVSPDGGRAEAGSDHLLDACYLSGGLDAEGHRPLDPVQQRFSDGSVEAWAERLAALSDGPTIRIGTALHSAVPEAALAKVADLFAPLLLHLHLSEQPAENQAVEGSTATPTALLARHGLLGKASTVVHATHLTGPDIALLGESKRQPASARPPSATWETASGRLVRC